jgi:hypothetical protein
VLPRARLQVRAAVDEAHPDGLVAAHAAAGEDEVERVGVPDQRGSRIVPPSINGTPHRRQYTPNTASVAATAEIAPDGELEPTGDGVTLDLRR